MLNELGYSVDLDVDPNAPDRVACGCGWVSRPGDSTPYELERRTRIRALEGQARLLLNDLNEYEACGDWNDGQPATPEEAADHWLREVYRPTLARIAAAVGPDRDLVQAYCDVLEEKWFLSEHAGRDVGLAEAVDAYLALGAPGARDRTPRRPDGRPRPARPGRPRAGLVRRRPRAGDRRRQRLGRRATIGPVSDRAGGVADPVIRVEDLHKAYGETRAVDGVSFEVAPGRSSACSGRTAPARRRRCEVLEGLRVPDRGDVRVLGIDVVRHADDLRARIGVSLQTAALYRSSRSSRS
jgi:ABC-type multidrug transport system fused ATPase/permease subunit